MRYLPRLFMRFCNPQCVLAAMAAVLVASLLSACGKVSDKLTEKATEKMIESSISKDGGTAKVDLSGGSAKVTSTDANGKTMQMEMGGAKITEADIGLPFYPGSKPIEGQSTKVSTGEGKMATLILHSDDTPDKVAEFYRGQLKAKAKGAELMDMNSGDGNIMLMLIDEKADATTQVSLKKAEPGTDVTVMASRGFKPK